jgi:DNA mismatch endonuclease (patch repair protein)
MSQIRQRDTAPEIAVRKVAYAMGMRYTTKNRDLPGSPDLANRSKKWAIFVHGCYWHRHEGCSHATTPKVNKAYWLAKFVRNVERDQQAKRSLTHRGYRVAIIWECDARNRLTPSNLEKAFRGELAVREMLEKMRTLKGQRNADSTISRRTAGARKK